MDNSEPVAPKKRGRPRKQNAFRIDDTFIQDGMDRDAIVKKMTTLFHISISAEEARTGQIVSVERAKATWDLSLFLRNVYEEALQNNEPAIRLLNEFAKSIGVNIVPTDEGDLDLSKIISEDRKPSKDLLSMLQSIPFLVGGVSEEIPFSERGTVTKSQNSITFDKKPSVKSAQFTIPTNQEMDVVMRAAGDGASGSNWYNDPQTGRRIYQIAGLPHHVYLALTDRERAMGIEPAALEKITQKADADCIFVLLYVSHLLAPPPGTLTDPRERPMPNGWIDLDDIAQKIGMQPNKKTAVDRVELRKRIWGYLQFGVMATVKGERNITYHDRTTRKEISTYIESPLWSLVGREREIPGLFDNIPDSGVTPLSDPPRRVEVALSPEWVRAVTNPSTAQYLPLGGLLGAIPPGKPGGAWARVIGLTLANRWRRHPKESIEPAIVEQTTPLYREELICRFTPSVAPPKKVLYGNVPNRAIIYWHEALGILVGCGFLEKRGEADPAWRENRRKVNPLPRKDWQSDWLKETVELYPGHLMLPSLEERAARAPNRSHSRQTLPKKNP